MPAQTGIQPFQGFAKIQRGNTPKKILRNEAIPPCGKEKRPTQNAHFSRSDQESENTYSRWKREKGIYSFLGRKSRFF